MYSSKDDAYVTLLKDKPLTVDEVNQYSNGVFNLTETGYGLVNYSDEYDCRYTGSYDTSTIKPIIDNWSENVIGVNNLGYDSLGYKARVITADELITDFGYENNFYCSSGCEYRGTIEFVPEWLYSSEYSYWMMPNENYVWDSILSNGELNRESCKSNRAIRPVITLKKKGVNLGE